MKSHQIRSALQFYFAILLVISLFSVPSATVAGKPNSLKDEPLGGSVHNDSPAPRTDVVAFPTDYKIPPTPIGTPTWPKYEPPDPTAKRASVVQRSGPKTTV
jgi:hypothetical protein